MSLDTWMLFLLAYLLATLTPGPNVLLVVKNGLQLGWRPALLTIGANLFCQGILIFLVAMGVGALLQTLPPLFLALKLAGGGYLIYLGYKSLRATGSGSQEAQRVGVSPPSRSNGSLLREGCVDELILYLAPSLVGDTARGLFNLPALSSLADKRQLAFRDVRMVGRDLRIVARPT
mgnify:FL=1